MAIDNKDKKVLNVPHMRFPEFTEEISYGEHRSLYFSNYRHLSLNEII